MGQRKPKRDVTSAQAIRILRTIPGLHAERDGEHLVVTTANGKQGTFRIEVRHRLGEQEAQRLARKLGTTKAHSSSSPPLLMTRRLTDHARDTFIDSGISWVEMETGLSHLSTSDIYVLWKQSDAAVPSPPPRARLRGLSGVIAETLLLRFRDREIKTTQLAQEASVSTGLASRVAQRLERERILRATGSGPHKRRFLKKPDSLLEVWAEEDDSRADEEVSLYVWAPTTKRLYASLNQLADADVPFALGGVAAANLYAPTLTVTPHPDVWIPAEIPLDDAVAILEGDPVDNGANVTIKRAAGDAPLRHARRMEGRSEQDEDSMQALPLVSPPRAFVEAACIHAGRSDEVATNLRRQRLEY